MTLVLVLGLVATLAASAVEQSAEAQTADPLRPDFSNWHPGDVHVHAAGDSGLGGHGRCDGLDDQACADRLVGQTMERADDNGLQWLVYTEHVAWLGVYRRTFCAPFEVACQTVVVPTRWERDQAARQFAAIESAAQSKARSRRDVRPLMGEELGAAASVSVISDGVSYQCDHSHPGHFGAYYVPTMVNNGAFDCDEVEYLTSSERNDAWGAVNHPDNGDGGSDWHCYHAGDSRDGGDCTAGVVDFADTDSPTQAATSDHDPVDYEYEIVSDDHLPTGRTLNHLDEMLQDGWLIGITGGSDSHTATRATLGANQSAGNDGKIGLRARTYAFAPGSITPQSSFRPDDAGDPIRRALRQGRTVASNGPMAVAQVNGTTSGDDGHFSGSTVDVRVDWPTNEFPYLSAGGGSISPGTPSPMDTRAHTPDTVAVVIGQVTDGECTQTDAPCASGLRRASFQPSPEDRARGWMTVPVTVPDGWDKLFVRVESLSGLINGNDSAYADNRQWSYGAFTSPLYLSRAVENGGPSSSESCRANTLARNDDQSTGSVSLPFAPNFFGTTYTSAFVNNNGNITFREPLGTFTPFRLTASTPPIIAPFFADVDTRGDASNETRYGTTTFEGRPAFCVYWEEVGYFSSQTDKLNTFRLYLVDRSDVGQGDFDIVFDYDRLLWETGGASGGSGGLGGTSAGAGFSSGNGDPNGFFELPGSLVNGAFLDSSATGLVNTSTNSLEPSIHRFEVRSGGASGTLRMDGRVVAASPGGAAVRDAVVEVCVEGQSQCPFVTVSDRVGGFSAFGLPAGRYTVRAFPPSRSRLSVGLVTGVEVAAGGPVPSVEVVLPGSGPAPAGTVVDPARPSEDGGFSIRPGVPLDFRVPGCAGAAATLEVRSGSTVVLTVNLAEGPAGVYGAPLAAFPAGPPLRFVVSFDCPDGVPDGQASFFVYIDPSGTVTDTTGDPVPGAIVTLLRADTSIGPFEPVEDGNAVMSPGNRANPDSTDDQGRFAWDVISGFYRVRAEATGCNAPGDASQAFVESDVLAIPPPALDIGLVLDCTRPSTGNLVVLMTVVDGTAGPFDYTGHCTLPDGTALDLGPLPVAEHEAKSLGSVPVGAACTVTQQDGDAVIALSGRALDITIAGDQDEVRFVNRLEPRPAYLTVTVERMDPSVGGELAVDVSCGSVPSQTVGVPVGSTATVSEPGEGASCTIRATAASGTELVGTREFVTSIVSPETNVRFQLRTSTAVSTTTAPPTTTIAPTTTTTTALVTTTTMTTIPATTTTVPSSPLCRVLRSLLQVPFLGFLIRILAMSLGCGVM